jgi:hypothetical protein
MSEEERKEEVQKVKVSRLAVASFVLMMPPLMYCLCAIIFPPKDTSIPLFILYSSMVLAGLVIALISLFQIKKSNGILVGKLFAGLSIAMFLLFSLGWMSRLIMHMREREARSFLIQAIGSINKQTDFYKKHSEKEALEEIEKVRFAITNNYKIILHYDTWSEYDYEVVFDRKWGCYVTIIRSKGSLVISDFYS